MKGNSMIVIKSSNEIFEKSREHLEDISRLCIKNKMTISVAESVTSGYLQLLLSAADNAQRFFQGGITVYNGAQKTRHLGIEPINAEASNYVSQSLSTDIARNVCNLFCIEIGIGITGFARLVPKDNINSLYAYVTIVKENKVLYKGKIKPSDSSLQGIGVQGDYSFQVLKQLAAKLIW
jgi:nicotinamide-nucleotide amidase